MSSLPKVTMKKTEAVTRLRDRISALDPINELPGRNQEELDEVSRRIEKWDNYTVSLLKKIFRGDNFLINFNNSIYKFESDVSLMGAPYYHKIANDYTLKRKSILESIIEQLDLLEEIQESNTSTQENILGNDIFIVHGHDNEAKLDVARTIEKLDLNAVILHERPNKGRTIIEKLTEESKNAGFAIILLTPDDIGAIKESAEVEERARQNVVLELGYFIGRLGRPRVCVLLKGSTQIPSDFSGVLYIPMDAQGKWKFDLAKELESVGFNIDLTKIN